MFKSNLQLRLAYLMTDLPSVDGKDTSLRRPIILTQTVRLRNSGMSLLHTLLPIRQGPPRLLLKLLLLHRRKSLIREKEPGFVS